MAELIADGVRLRELEATRLKFEFDAEGARKTKSQGVPVHTPIPD